MTVSEMIDNLQNIKLKHGDVDITWIDKNQYCDIMSVTAHTRDNHPQLLDWVFSGTVAVIDLDHS